VLSAETLRLFPGAHHLDNAWDIPRREAGPGAGRGLVVLSTIDERFDFDFVGEIARLLPDRAIAIHGYVLHDDPAIAERLAGLCGRHPNVGFKGRYRFDDVPEIVRPFSIGLTPYVASTPMTEFINPDKYYLFLQAGIEVISTDIPQARRLTDRIHIAASAADAADIVRRLEAEPAFRKNAAPAGDLTWAKRARDFIEILRVASRATGRRNIAPAAKPTPRSAQPERLSP
jgi:hypothetical protein